MLVFVHYCALFFFLCAMLEPKIRGPLWHNYRLQLQLLTEPRRLPLHGIPSPKTSSLCQEGHELNWLRPMQPHSEPTRNIQICNIWIFSKAENEWNTYTKKTTSASNAFWLQTHGWLGHSFQPPFPQFHVAICLMTPLISSFFKNEPVVSQIPSNSKCAHRTDQYFHPCHCPSNPNSENFTSPRSVFGIHALFFDHTCFEVCTACVRTTVTTCVCRYFPRKLLQRFFFSKERLPIILYNNNIQ
jgi:hypothetical protein